MSKVMMTIKSNHVPSLEELQKQFELQVDDVDQSFGVIEIDSEQQLYTFMIEESKAIQLKDRFCDQGWLEYSGPYSNPKIDTFGPPCSDSN
jgi:hypothetical protein